MRKEGTSDFFCWREQRLKPNTVSFALGELVEIEGFGYREADRVHPALMKTAILQRPEAGTYKHGLH